MLSATSGGYSSGPSSSTGLPAACTVPASVHMWGREEEVGIRSVASVAWTSLSCGICTAATLTGAFVQVPYIEDPNTGTAMFESSKIIQYLNETYAV